MRTHRSQGQIINNFFTLVTIVIMTAVLSIYVKYGPKQQVLHSNLPCQKQTPTYDKVVEPALLSKGFNLLSSGAYVLDGGIIKPRFGKSYFSKLLTIEQSNEYFIQSIQKQPLDKNYVLKIRYELFENDKNDPRKSESEKKHAGELITFFKINNEVIFRMNTQINTLSKDEIKQRIQCSVKAFIHNANK